MKERIIRLVKILAAPNQELVIDIIISKDIILNSIEVLDDDFRINVWLDDMEFQYDSGQLNDQEMQIIISSLEAILMN
jgi:hypothetical protein